MGNPSPQSDGLALTLPKNYDNPDGHDWRMAMFSLVLPVPPTGLPGSAGGQHLIKLGPQWHDGRFPGVTAIQVPGPTGTTTGGITPKAITTPAAKRFAAPLKDSVGAGDAAPRMFVHQEFGHRFALTPDDDPDATVSLAAAEFLQYRGIRTHDGSGTDLELGFDYLVLHILVETCSSATLDTVSRALHRPNQKPARIRLRAARGSELSPDGEDRLLPLMCRTVLDELNSGLPADDTAGSAGAGFYFTVAHGGFLFGRSTGKGPAHHAGDLVAGPAGFARVLAGRTIRSVCAVPGAEQIDVPPQFADFLTEEQLAESDVYWSPADMWAWSLSAGGDKYAEGIPDLRYDSCGDSLFGSYHFWATASSPSGVAVVRTLPADNCDTKPWRLSSTLYLDLLLLVHRSREYLGQLGRRLREFHLDVPHDVDGITDTRSARENLQYLENKSALFGDIQADLVFFRDHLWFETVPDHETDTRLLRAYRDATGITERYDDITSEIALRKDVYTTLHQTVRLRLDRILNDLKDEEHAAQVERDRRQNLMLGFLALAFALPGILQMSPMTGQWSGFAITVLVVIVFIIGFLLLLRRNRDR